MFNKLKAKAAKPLTYGWLFKCYLGELIAVGIIYGGMWAYSRYLEKQFNEVDAAAKENNEFENEED